MCRAMWLSANLLVSNMLTMFRTVSILKGLQSPLTSARWSSSTVKLPELSVSTALNQLQSWGLAPGGGPWGGGAGRPIKINASYRHCFRIINVMEIKPHLTVILRRVGLILLLNRRAVALARWWWGTSIALLLGTSVLWRGSVALLTSWRTLVVLGRRAISTWGILVWHWTKEKKRK